MNIPQESNTDQDKLFFKAILNHEWANWKHFISEVYLHRRYLLMAYPFLLIMPLVTVWQFDFFGFSIFDVFDGDERVRYRNLMNGAYLTVFLVDASFSIAISIPLCIVTIFLTKVIASVTNIICQVIALRQGQDYLSSSYSQKFKIYQDHRGKILIMFSIWVLALAGYTGMRLIIQEVPLGTLWIIKEMAIALIVLAGIIFPLYYYWLYQEYHRIRLQEAANDLKEFYQFYLSKNAVRQKIITLLSIVTIIVLFRHFVVYGIVRTLEWSTNIIHQIMLPIAEFATYEYFELFEKLPGEAKKWTESQMQNINVLWSSEHLLQQFQKIELFTTSALLQFAAVVLFFDFFCLISLKMYLFKSIRMPYLRSLWMSLRITILLVIALVLFELAYDYDLKQHLQIVNLPFFIGLFFTLVLAVYDNDEGVILSRFN